MEKDQLYEKEIIPLLEKASKICAKQGWEFSAIVAFKTDRYNHYHSGAERYFIKHSTTLSRILQVHGMNLLYRPIDPCNTPDD